MLAMSLLTALLLQPGTHSYEIAVPGEMAFLDEWTERGLNFEMAHTVSVPITLWDTSGEWSFRTSTEGEDVRTTAQVSRLGPWGGEAGSWAALVIGYEGSSRGSLEDSPADEGEGVDGGLSDFALTHEAGDLVLREGEEDILRYAWEPRNAEGPEPRFERADYLHIHGMDGRVLTDDFPLDHPHQGGLVWRFPKVTWGDRAADGWNLVGLYARPEELLGHETGPLCAVFGIRSGWFAGASFDAADAQRIAEEDVWIRVWRATGAGRRIDVAVTVRPLVEGLTVEGRAGTGYGGFALRAAGADSRAFTTSEGEIAGDAPEAAGEWADVTLTNGDRANGVTLWTDDDYPGAPVRWFIRDYGLLSVRWSDLGAREVPTEGLSLGYHLWVHGGDVWSGSAPLAHASWRWTSGATAE